MSGGVSDVVARDNLMGDPTGSVTGLLIKSERGRGGYVRRIRFERNHLLNVSIVYSWIPALVISDYYGNHKETNVTATPQIENVSFIDTRVDFAEQIGCLMGLPEAPLRGIIFSNLTIGGNHTGFACANCIDCGICRGPGSTACAFH